MEQQEVLKHQLDKLTQEHRELDQMIERMMNERIVNQIAVMRLKKRKLLIKDQIIRVRGQMLPDILA